MHFLWGKQEEEELSRSVSAPRSDVPTFLSAFLHVYTFCKQIPKKGKKVPPSSKVSHGLEGGRDGFLFLPQLVPLEKLSKARKRGEEEEGKETIFFEADPQSASLSPRNEGENVFRSGGKMGVSVGRGFATLSFRCLHTLRAQVR